MIIDLTKLIYGNLYKLPVKGEVIVPIEMLKNTDIRRISPVKVEGYIFNNEEDFELNITIKGTSTNIFCHTIGKISSLF